MKKLFVESVGMVFMILFIPVYVWGDNAVFNAGFDMSPWDSGWTIETDTSYGGYTSAEAEVKPDSGKSSPNCCYLRTYSQIDAPGGGGPGEAVAKAMITQNFDGITDCKIKAYVKWNWFPLMKSRKAYVMMEGCINNEWKIIWKTGLDVDIDNVRTTWTEVGTTLVSDTLSGIRFCAESSFYTTCHIGRDWSYSYLWIDDIYVGKAGIEESEELRVTSYKLQVYPNPFVQSAIVRFEDSRLQIKDYKIQVYDMVGQLAEETNVGLEDCKIGEKLLPGVYFVKVRGYKPAKIIKLMEVL